MMIDCKYNLDLISSTQQSHTSLLLVCLYRYIFVLFIASFHFVLIIFVFYFSFKSMWGDEPKRKKTKTFRVSLWFSMCKNPIDFGLCVFCIEYRCASVSIGIKFNKRNENKKYWKWFFDAQSIRNWNGDKVITKWILPAQSQSKRNVFVVAVC